VSLAELESSSGPREEFGRTPPQDVAAEQSVLGGMLLSKDAIADVIEVLRGNDFYVPRHETVFEAVLDLYGRGEPADAVTVAAELTKRGDLAAIGGPAYLHTLLSSVPTAANAGYYARIVHERAVLRRLVTAGTRIVQLGYATDGGDVDEIVNAAQAEVYAVTERRTSEDYQPLSAIIEGAIDEIEASSHRGDGLTGIPTGFADLDRLTNGFHGGQMIVIAARPAVGKSTLGLDVARSAAIHHKLPSVIFSLEMGRNEITMRLLSAEARIPLQNMRKGTMREEDWTRLARTMGDVSDAPLFIDDSPNMSLMEIRAKCRRLKQKHGLKLVIVDYLQLMTSGKRVESRQQEVSEFSRALKLLAKELEVPVIALSQLNRGPEQRTDKKPQMSDLRESGCLTADTKILRADTGAETTLGQLYAEGVREVPVWSLDDSLRYVRRHLTHVFPTGRRQVYRLTLASGKTLRLTANHPMLAYEGWLPVGELTMGSRVAVPRHVPAPECLTVWDDAQVTLLAHLLGDGSFVARQPIRYGGIDEASHQKFVPEPVFHLPKRQIALFLRHLWATDGSVTIGKDGRGGRVHYAGTSRELIDGVARLLLRFGISCRIRQVRTPGYRDGWTLDISGAEDQKRFLGEIGVHGERGRTAARLLGIVAAKQSNPHIDTVPSPVWNKVRAVLAERGRTHRESARATDTQFRGLTTWKHSPSRERLSRVAELLGDQDLEMLAVNDVLWDEIQSIEPDGEEEVFDATVLGTHNFVANGIVVHNSIEQDADMVILLHREDMYEKESPRAGEADFIVAKHRNGPTDTITVAFQGHYSRFVDMAT
jgi:replicative DNA helicase